LIEITKDDILIGTSHKYNEKNQITKYSYHIVIDSKKYNLIYPNNRFDNEDTAADLVYQLHNRNPKYIEIIDRSVYSADREMRMYFCNKSPETIRLIQYHNKTMKNITFEEYSRTIINYINPDKEILYISTTYRENPKRILHTESELIKIEQNKQKWTEKVNSKTEQHVNKSDETNMISEIVNNLGSYRADNYDEWINILFILKNQSLIDKTDYFKLFDNFSKQSIKYDYNELLDYWTNNQPRQNGLTIGTLINYLIQDNEKAWDYINKKYNHSNSTEIITNFYYPDPTKYFTEITEYNDKTTHDFKIKQGHKGAFINIEMGMGKTETLFKQIKQHNKNLLINVKGNNFLNYEKPFKRILIITHRRSLAGKFYGDLQNFFKLYFDYKKHDVITTDRIIIQLDSLWKLSLNEYDLVILDECESLFSHLKYKNMRNKQEIIDMLSHHIKNSQRVILMDANMSIKSFEIMKMIDDLTKYTYITNKYKILDNWKMTFMNGEEQTELIRDDIKQNNKVVVSSLSKNTIDSHYLKLIPDYVYYSSDTDNEEKFKGVMKVDETWLNKNVLYTPTISAGVSCTIKDQFVNIYGYANNQSANATDFIQMLRRCRYPINHNFNIWYEETNNHKPFDLLTIESIEDYIKYSCSVSNNANIINDLNKFITNGKYEVRKDLYYFISIYNLLEEHINRCYFKEVLSTLATNKGIIIFDSNRLTESTDKFDKQVKDAKIEMKNELIEKLSTYEPITNEDYDIISTKMTKEDKITDDEKHQHKLKTLLNRFKYTNDQYNQLDTKNKMDLIKFISDDDNHLKFIHNSVINSAETIDKAIKQLTEQDTQRLQNGQNDHEFKPYARMHFLINELIKLIGFNDLFDQTKLDNEVIKANITKSKTDFINIIKEINYFNKTKSKDKITNPLKTINTIINNFYGYKLERLQNMTKNKRITLYKLVNTIKWGESYLPTIQKNTKLNNNDYLF